MRTGLFARTRANLVQLVATAALCAALPMTTHGQSPYGAQPQNARPANSRPMQALYMAPNESGTNGQQPNFDSYGNPMIIPAGYCEQCGGCNGNCGCCDGGCNCGGCNGGCAPGCGGGFNTCMPMGCGGTDPPNGYELMNDVGSEGEMVDQRGPHYFDARVEAVYLHRDVNFGQNIDFTSLNVGNTVVLSSNQLDLNEQVGFRVMGRYDICPLSVVEFGYMGIFDWSDKASVSDPTNNLYSLFSRPAPGTGLFGTSPAGVNLPNGPNPQSERASRQSISLDSDLQTAEITYRRYWLGYIPRVSGTLLAGFRYTRVTDDFLFSTQGSEPLPNTQTPLAALRYSDDAENNLAGFQTGGDIWIGLMQGLRIGSEGKVGLYNNHYTLTNRITTTPPGSTPPSLEEEFHDNKAAFIGEASVDLVADILPSISLRAGYEVLFLDSLVLAGDNFNQTSPYGNQGVRVPFVHDSGELFYHGAHAGIEYIW